MVLESFTDAHGLFLAAREAARERERCIRQLEAMRLTGGGSDGIKVSRGSVSDPMARVDGIMDMETRWRDAMAADEALMEHVTLVLYGRDRDGGVAALLGSVYADVMWWHYLAGETWKRTGEIVHYSRTRCYQMGEEVCDLVDALGVDAVIRGVGFAEE